MTYAGEAVPPDSHAARASQPGRDPEPVVDPAEPPPARDRAVSDEGLLQRADRRLSQLSPIAIERSAVALTLALGIVDYAVGPEPLFSIFYLLPIGLTAWYGTARAGQFLCLLAAATGLCADLLAGVSYDHQRVMLWNVGVWLGTFLVVATLTTRLRVAVEARQASALSDALTGLANSRAFGNRLKAEIERGSRYGRVFTVAYLDLDHFKEVNDTLGHSEGDEVLRRVAATMRESLRATDMVARLGGDEFGILLPETPFVQGERALEKLRAHLLRAMEEGGWPVTASIGAVTFEAPIDRADEAIRIADRLMYEVKSEGRDAIRHLLWTGAEEE